MKKKQLRVFNFIHERFSKFLHDKITALDCVITIRPLFVYKGNVISHHERLHSALRDCVALLKYTLFAVHSSLLKTVYREGIYAGGANKQL